jgi:hypothetical protein
MENKYITPSIWDQCNGFDVFNADQLIADMVKANSDLKKAMRENKI